MMIGIKVPEALLYNFFFDLVYFSFVYLSLCLALKQLYLVALLILMIREDCSTL